MTRWFLARNMCRALPSNRWHIAPCCTSRIELELWGQGLLPGAVSAGSLGQPGGRPLECTMAEIAEWFSRGTRAITVGTVFVLLVLLALVVAPVVTSVLAISTHAHVREVDERVC